MSIPVFDASEFQKVIDWPRVVDPGIIRVHNSARPDNYAQVNIAGARRYCPWRGWYQYLSAGADPVAAAHAFQATLGPTLPGEVMILDLEEGSGDQRGRRAAWLGALQDDHEWVYSGLSFARTHLPGVRIEWLAAYGQGEPGDSHTLWQNTDARRFAGIAAPCDGSLFSGTLAQLQALTNTPGVDMPITAADADLIMKTILGAKLGSSGPNVAVALQHAAALPGADVIAAAVVKALPPIVVNGGNLAPADITAAVEAGLRNVLGSLK